MEGSSKKKSSKSRTSERESSSQDFNMSDSQSSSSGIKPKKKLTPAESSVSKKKASRIEVSSSTNTEEVENISDGEPNNNTTTTTTTTTSLNSSYYGQSPVSVPTTPITKLLQSTGLNTPMSPNRSIHRLKEKEDLSTITKRLSACLKQLEEKHKEVDRKEKEIEVLEKNYTSIREELHRIKTEADRKVKAEVQEKLQLSTQIGYLNSEIDSRESSLKSIEESYQNTITQLNQENKEKLDQLHNTINENNRQINSYTNEVKRLKEQLEFSKIRDEEKTRKLLDSEYARMKNIEDDFNRLIEAKEQEIQQIRIEHKERDRQFERLKKSETEHQQIIESHNRQIEDAIDENNRKWEMKMAKEFQDLQYETSSFAVRYQTLSDEKEKLEHKLHLTLEDLKYTNAKNGELSEEIDRLKENEQRFAKDREEYSKKLHQANAALKLADIQIKDLQVNRTQLESKANEYYRQMSDLQQEILVANEDTAPEILLTREIEKLKELTNGLEKSVSKDDRKRKRHKFEHSPSGHVLLNGDEDQHENEMNGVEEQQEPQQIEALNVETNTARILEVSAKDQFIKLQVVGDIIDGFSLSDWKIIVSKPGVKSIGFKFPDNIQPIRGVGTITLWTGRSRPETQTPENEFYWVKPDIWDTESTLEGTVIKLRTSGDSSEVSNITLNKDGYFSDTPKQSCLIM